MLVVFESEEGIVYGTGRTDRLFTFDALGRNLALFDLDGCWRNHGFDFRFLGYRLPRNDCGDGLPYRLGLRQVHQSGIIRWTFTHWKIILYSCE